MTSVLSYQLERSKFLGLAHILRVGNQVRSFERRIIKEVCTYLKTTTPPQSKICTAIGMILKYHSSNDVLITSRKYLLQYFSIDSRIFPRHLSVSVKTLIYLETLLSPFTTPPHAHPLQSTQTGHALTPEVFLPLLLCLYCFFYLKYTSDRSLSIKILPVLQKLRSNACFP